VPTDRCTRWLQIVLNLPERDLIVSISSAVIIFMERKNAYIEKWLETCVLYYINIICQGVINGL
jgi:hypothetical protein